MSKTCVAIINEGPRKGNVCQFPPKDNEYCDRHQRNKIYDDAIKEGKQYCRFFFRGCDNLTEEGYKSCKLCKETRTKKHYKCLREECKFNVEIEGSYCGKHKIDELKAYEKENNVKYCKINRGCRNILVNGQNNCDECNNKYKNELNALREQYNTPFLYKVFNKELCEFQNRKTDSINEFWRNITRGANERNMLFTLSYEDYIKITLQPCYYCGFQSEYKVNGIDRINNNKGYIQSNCLSCCKMCNIIKHINHPIAFIDKINAILNYMEHNVQISNALLEKWKHVYLTSYTAPYLTYKNEVKKKKNIEMTLTKEEYNLIKSKACYLCGIKPSTNHKNGIDRVNSEIKEYSLENSMPCCSHCNLMKNEYNLYVFLNKCREIKNRNCNINIFNEIPIIHEKTQKRQEYYSNEDIEVLIKMGHYDKYKEWLSNTKA
jgi:hypothetical protein